MIMLDIVVVMITMIMLLLLMFYSRYFVLCDGFAGAVSCFIGNNDGTNRFSV